MVDGGGEEDGWEVGVPNGSPDKVSIGKTHSSAQCHHEVHTPSRLLKDAGQDLRSPPCACVWWV